MITLEEIIFNSLMPWSSRNSDDFLFEELFTELSWVTRYEVGIYFVRLPHILREMDLNSIPELEAEWRFFAGTHIIMPDGIQKELFVFKHQKQKVRFYARLVSCCAFAELNLLAQDFEKRPNHNYQRYKLSNITLRLERIITAPVPGNEHSEEDLIIIKLTKLAAILIYLDIIAHYNRTIHTERLKLTPEAVFEELAQISMISRTTGTIAKRMKYLYLPYFRTGPEAYRDDDILPPSMLNKNKTGAELKYVNSEVEDAAKKQIDPVNQKQNDKKDKNLENRIIGTGEAIRILGCSSPTLKRWRDDGIVPYSQPNPKGRCFYKLSEIHEIAKTMKMKRVTDG